MPTRRSHPTGDRTTRSRRGRTPWIVGAVIALTGVVPGPARAGTAFVDDQRVVYSDGLHSENTAMIRLGRRILLAFRGGEQGQIGSARARINIFESRDRGRTFRPLSEVDASGLPGGRDIRDPKLVAVHGRLFLYAISRLPGFHYRDLGGQAWAVRAESRDGGRTWTAPVKTFADVDAAGAETFWGFWRYTMRSSAKGGRHHRTLFPRSAPCASPATRAPRAAGRVSAAGGLTGRAGAFGVDLRTQVADAAHGARRSPPSGGTTPAPSSRRSHEGGRRIGVIVRRIGLTVTSGRLRPSGRA
jgi:hypothetical protein